MCKGLEPVNLFFSGSWAFRHGQQATSLSKHALSRDLFSLVSQGKKKKLFSRTLLPNLSVIHNTTLRAFSHVQYM